MSNTEERVETVKPRFIAGNSFALLWIIVGTVACWLVNPRIDWLFLAFSAFSIYIIIRRLLCNSCTRGFAKLSILFLGANKIPGQNKNTIIGITVFAYFALLLIPGGLLVNPLETSFSSMKLVVLICLLTVSATALIARMTNRNRSLWKH